MRVSCIVYRVSCTYLAQAAQARHAAAAATVVVVVVVVRLAHREAQGIVRRQWAKGRDRVVVRPTVRHSHHLRTDDADCQSVWCITLYHTREVHANSQSSAT